ncbi:hypothetical protein O181_076275 [Austropuccinia psidii MF-1]|uniref:Uncharacterized protein n=1 Tax=Austropuccinia psidii MF-1 TaxID=1389203 RepID=A0A9Q3IEV1_9BASI|nr:hypothetical protein [Austropuccinia psidii MF-1]
MEAQSGTSLQHRLKSGESQEPADSDYNDTKAKLPIDLLDQSEQHQPTAPSAHQASEVLLSRAVTSIETDHLHAVLPDQETQLASATGDIHDDPLTERVASPEASFPLQNILVEQDQPQAQSIAGVVKEAPTSSGLVMLLQTSKPYEQPAKTEESAFNDVAEDHSDPKISEAIALETMAELKSVAPTNMCTVSEGVTSSNYDRPPPKLSGEGVALAKAVSDINVDKPTDKAFTLQPIASPGTLMPKDTHTEQAQQPVVSESSSSMVFTLIETDNSLDTPLEQSEQPVKAQKPLAADAILKQSATLQEEPILTASDASKNHVNDMVVLLETFIPNDVENEQQEGQAAIGDKATSVHKLSEGTLEPVATLEADKPLDTSAEETKLLQEEEPVPAEETELQQEEEPVPAEELKFLQEEEPVQNVSGTMPADPSASVETTKSLLMTEEEELLVKIAQEDGPALHATTLPASQTNKQDYIPTEQVKPPFNPAAESLSTGSLAATSTETVALSESETNSNIVVPNNQEKEGVDLVRSSCDTELNHEASQEPAAAFIKESTIHTHAKKAVVSAVHVPSTVAPSAGDDSSNLGEPNSSKQTTGEPSVSFHGAFLTITHLYPMQNNYRHRLAKPLVHPPFQPTTLLPSSSGQVELIPLLNFSPKTDQETSKEEALASANPSSNQASLEQSNPQALAPCVTNSEDTIHNKCVPIPTTESEVQPTLINKPTILIDDTVPTYLLNYALTPAFLSSPPPSMLSIPKPPVNPTNTSKCSPSLIVTNIAREVILPPVMKTPSLILLKSSQSTFFQASESIVLICSSTLTPHPQHCEENVNPPTAIPCVSTSSSVQTQASLIVPQATPKAELRLAASVHSCRKLVKHSTNNGYMSPTSAAAKTQILAKPKTRPISNFESQSAAKSLIPVLSRPISCRGQSDANIAPIRSPKRVLKGVTLVDPRVPPASSTHCLAEGLIEVDSFTLIDKPDKAAHHDNNHFRSAKLRRRLTNSVKDMLQRRHSQTAKSTSLSPALKEVPIANGMIRVDLLHKATCSFIPLLHRLPF